jgi:Domain of Unknown Function with PDB structure (DUF3857)/Transglutaminase-like superfamily
MRTHGFMRFPLLLLVVVSPALVRAQFIQPTPEELKMTADPKYPDAAAVYLYREYKTDDTVHYQSEHVRIKVLTEKGKDLATVNLGYLRGNSTINAIQGRTIHSDGTVIALNVKPTDLLRAKEGEAEVHEVVFNLPSVEVGSILEYYYQIRYDEHMFSNPRWEIQQRFPVRKAHFTFMAFPGYFGNHAGVGGNYLVNYHGEALSDLMWYPNLPKGVTLTGTENGHFDLIVNDVPPLPEEQWMPPIETQRFQVIFYYTPGNSSQAYWTNESGYWLKDVNHFAETTGTIKAAAAGLLAAGDSDIDKAKKLYAAVQALDNTNFSRVKSKDELKKEGLKPAKRAEDTWTQKSGSAEDIALLYLALLRGAGLTAYPMKVVNRDRAIFNDGYLNFSQLNDLIIILSAGGKDIFLDPGEKMCPFQMVHWKHSGAGGVRQMDKGTGIAATPLLPYSANGTTRRAELTVNTDGSVAGKLQFGFTGQEALHWRQEALRVEDTVLKQEFDDWLKSQVPSGVQAQFVRFAKLDEPDSDLAAYATVTGTPGSATGKRLLLPGTFFSSTKTQVFIEQPNRTEPVDMHYAEQVKDGVLYHLPAGFTVESMPQTASVPWPTYAVLQIKVTANGNDVTVTHTLARAFSFLGADDYGHLRDFYQKVATADQQPLVLAVSAPAQGN